MGEGKHAWCVFSPNYNKKACQTWRRRWRRPESIFRRARLSPHRRLDRQKDSVSAGLFFLAGLSALFYFFSATFLFLFVLTAWQERREQSFASEKSQNRIPCARVSIWVLYFRCLCLCVHRVGKRVRVRHELHSQCGHQRASGGCGRSQAGGD